LDNLVLLCRRHHRAVHEDGFTVVRRRDGSASFFHPDGQPLDVAPLPPRWASDLTDPLSPTVGRMATAGLTIDGYRTTRSWDGTPFDAVWAIDVLRGRETGGHAGRMEESPSVSAASA
jgi:hypothetical protein